MCGGVCPALARRGVGRGARSRLVLAAWAWEVGGELQH
ncbi:hypothetical protein HMPREF1522_1007 [Actinomyces sp. ICM54]|nr:hypothetical protein HMPREF1522_1007 [Actinomyces sp. ICM54]